MNVLALMGAPPPQGEGGGSAILPMVLMWVTILGIFYFLLIRPQRKKQTELKQQLDSLKRGDKVLTTGGLYGSIVGIKEGVVVLKIADQVKVEVAKGAITTIVEKSREA
jgi:preprotein translocase subunit YajC